MVRTSAPPVLLPNWTSTSLRSLPLTPDSWFFDPHTIPDFGGSGFCEDASSGRRVQLKCGARLPIRCRNGINSALFLSAATPLPADISSPHSSFNHNRIIFHPETRSILCKSGTSSVTLCCLEQVPPDQHPLSHRVRSGDPSDSAVRFVRSYPLDRRHRKQSAGVLDLVDIQKHRTSDHILLNCVNGACIGSISKDGAAAEFEILSRIPVPAFPKSADLVFLSTNPFVGLEHEITAIVRSGHAAEASKTDYLMIFDCRSQLWRKTGKTGLTSGTRCMYSSNDHPRQVLVADDHSFKLCDHRVSESAASLLIFSSRKNAHLFPFEEIMSGTSFTRAHQHLVLSDMHVDLVDERFPGDSLLQVAHCADSRPGNRVSRIRCQEVSSGDRMPDQAPDALVLVSNDHLVCLLCLSPTRGVVQPQLCDSLVHAFHLNDFPDSLSSSGCDSWQSRMSRSRDLSIDGLDLIPSPAGFSLVAVTRNGDLFLQDLERVGESDERRGTSFSTQSDASLDLRTTEYLNYSIFNILARKGSVSVRKGPANSLKERQPCKQPSCKCCYEWSTGNSIPLEVQPGAGSPGPLPTPQSSLFLQKLHQLAPLMDGTADCGQEKAEQTVEQGDLPKWNLLTHDLLHAWSLSSQVSGTAASVEVVNQEERRSS